MLGFKDIHDLASVSERDNKIKALKQASSCSTEYCVLALRDHDINAFARVVSEVKVNFVLITLTTLNIPGSLNGATSGGN